jgi:hypothetical protein
MNPDQHRASEVRRRALDDQIDGLEQRIAAGRDEPHVTQRLADTRAELGQLDSRPLR